MQDELLLLHRAKTNDPEALATIHDRYYDAIYRYFSFRVGSAQVAEDLTSDVFTRFLDALHEKSAPQNTIRGWLFGAASLVLKEHYRAKKRANDREMVLHERLTSGGQSPAQQVETQLARETLREAMTDLTEDQQKVLALRYAYEMPIKEVAQLLNKSEGSIKQLRARALTALSKRLRENM